ncbi:uncharacterized protein LOC114758276 [Neltuma alba]|uniref:uncharacterized protein LOC114758276 n=1 Tax=Neltuma alba TaxID=207710 RepID=UPI0010A5373E|nr:uncharacterized protein LOC114758276 [Prosopis alba]
MRLSSSSSGVNCSHLEKFSQCLLDIGDGNLDLPHDGVAKIEIPSELLVNDYEDLISAIVSSTYSNLIENIDSSSYFNDRVILAPIIDVVNQVNEYMCSLLPGELVDYFRYDSICKSLWDDDGIDDLYTTEFLNTFNSSGLPSHKLTLKVGSLIMLLRNINQAYGLCSGTRLRVTHLGKFVIEAITLSRSHSNQKVVIHCTDMDPSNSWLSFMM